eukprot:gene15056-17309_t
MQWSRHMLRHIRCTKCADVACLLKVPEQELFKAQSGWAPVIDGVDLTAAGVDLAA